VLRWGKVGEEERKRVASELAPLVSERKEKGKGSPVARLSWRGSLLD
jgi:hypothetical protein